MQEECNFSPDLGLGTTVLAVMGATALVAVFFLLSPWNVSHIADKSAPRTTYVAAPLQSGEYGAGLELAIARRWLWKHASGHTSNLRRPARTCSHEAGT